MPNEENERLAPSRRAIDHGRIHDSSEALPRDEPMARNLSVIDCRAFEGISGVRGGQVDEIVYGSLIGMAEQVRAGEVSPVELVEAHLARIERLNPKLNAFANVDAERARARARAAEAAAAAPGGKNALGSLHGVPVTVKSSIDVARLACECGSVLRKGNTPEADAPLVARLRGAGAIILGNTNVPEFLMAYESDNLLYGRTNNPWDLLRTPGGSGGGESAAIAAGCSAGGGGGEGGGR